MLGSSKSEAIEYKIQNFGETAYLPLIRIFIPDNIAFMRIPPNCQMDNTDLVCVINGGAPLSNNSFTLFKVHFDMTKASGSALLIKAQVNSTGDELHFIDNSVEDVITLSQMSDIEIVG